jgi:RHS repeat-associated protein
MLQQQNGEVFLCVNDHLGMPKDLVAGDGAVAWSATHSAYGRVVATYADDAARARYGTAINSPFRLLGQVADDDAELCFTRYRCFDPEIGAWISSDPLEIAGGLNLYGFDGAPTDVVDPLGLATGGGNPHGPAQSPQIKPEELKDKTPDEIRQLAADKGLVPHATKPDKYMDPVTGKERLRLDQGHIDKQTGLPYDDPKAAAPHVHGYEPDGATKIRDPGDNNPHFPTK